MTTKAMATLYALFFLYVILFIALLFLLKRLYRQLKSYDRRVIATLVATILFLGARIFYYGFLLFTLMKVEEWGVCTISVVVTLPTCFLVSSIVLNFFIWTNSKSEYLVISMLLIALIPIASVLFYVCLENQQMAILVYHVTVAVYFFLFAILCTFLASQTL